MGKRRALISSELAASTGLCFPARPKSLNSLGTLNGNILMRPSDGEDAGCHLQEVGGGMSVK